MNNHKPHQNPSGCNDHTAQVAVNAVMCEKYPPACISFDVPIPPSVNHAYITTHNKQRVLSSEAKRWTDAARLLAGAAVRKHGWRFSEKGKLIMHLWAFWPDGKRRDIHNLHKLIADAFEGVLYQDDKWLLIHDEDFTVDRQRPRVEIVLREFDKYGAF